MSTGTSSGFVLCHIAACPSQLQFSVVSCARQLWSLAVCSLRPLGSAAEHMYIGLSWLIANISNWQSALEQRMSLKATQLQMGKEAWAIKPCHSKDLFAVGLDKRGGVEALAQQIPSSQGWLHTLGHGLNSAPSSCE
ncbi:unnamed protein product [Ostreobium quekettii]|uniref:Uncharacterized protein n=1 Tax=Ostreobium quekettii TaxID=121088 RepID=A0A8S1JEP6_9CHLO|nr:unnamed protein product [Ostreobium quekettii]